MHGLPGGAVPELRVVVAADDGDVLHQAGKIPQLLRQERPALRVKLALRGAGKNGRIFFLSTKDMALTLSTKLCQLSAL